MQISASNLIASQQYVRPAAGRTAGTSGQASQGQGFSVDASDGFSSLSFKTVSADSVVQSAQGAEQSSVQSGATAAKTPARYGGTGAVGSMIDITV